MGLQKTAEHESGYFEEEDFDDRRVSAPSALSDKETRDREYSYSYPYPVCLEDDCWCLDGRIEKTGECLLLSLIRESIVIVQKIDFEILLFLL